MRFSDDEIETIKSLICEWGSDCPDTDSDKVKKLEYKLGLSVKPTPEEIAERERRDEEFRNTSFAIMMKEMFKSCNRALIESMAKNVMFDETNLKIGSTLRIKLPNDFEVKKD